METRSIFDYVGKIDGVAFDGGSTDGKGTDLAGKEAVFDVTVNGIYE